MIYVQASRTVTQCHGLVDLEELNLELERRVGRDDRRVPASAVGLHER
jgi:hypothetical protein